MPVVATGTPVTVQIPRKAKKVAIAAQAAAILNLDVAFRISEAGDAIDNAWSTGQLTNLAKGFEIIDCNPTSVTFTGDGTFNIRVLY